MKSNNLSYTGVGSRNTPDEILRLMAKIAANLSSLGYKLRTGDAKGADHAFRFGANKNCETFTASDCTPEAMAISSQYHGAWHRCSDYAKRLHGRNAFQILGRSLNQPSSFLICWTQDGACSHQERSISTGGTGTAISIASENNIPIFNLSRPNHYQRLMAFIDAK